MDQLKNDLNFKSFIDQCIDQDLDLFNSDPLDLIDDFISQWHTGEGESISLIKYLGMSEEEYNIWIHNPKYLYSILISRFSEKIEKYNA